MPREKNSRGKLVVLTIVGLALISAAVKFAQETRIEPHVQVQILKLRSELESLNQASLRADEHRALRRLLGDNPTFAEICHYSDRAIPLVEEQYRRDRRIEGSALPAAWLLALVKSSSTRALAFLEEELPRIAEPDLRRDTEQCIGRLRAYEPKR